ncbi:MAG TPA: NAD-dependent deacylase [Ignavibacteria bacterium]|nr:NAD-dependent deacylase [Ignavibacteria bacterium]HMR38938.1 NAD-dependent deacylase [Ignavibacteria bacterium]
MNTKKKIVVLTGSGISAESGLSTFRDSGGLWEGHDVMEVASPEGWRRNRELVLDFYNQRRRQLKEVVPNDAHIALKDLEDKYDVTIITQNVDDLHERAGSVNIIHLHGELNKARSTVDEDEIYDLNGEDITTESKCVKGSQLRPHIVWFGEMVPMMDEAIRISLAADIFIVIGTSLVVYPAASLLGFVKDDIPVYLIDPNEPGIYYRNENLKFIKEKAAKGTRELVKELLQM